MLIYDRMKQPGVTFSPDVPIHEALGIIKREQIRHIPVLQIASL